MPPYMKIEPELLDDDRWAFLPGVGKVRSGPRGRRYQESLERKSFSTDSAGISPSTGSSDEDIRNPVITSVSGSDQSNGNLDAGQIKQETDQTDSASPAQYRLSNEALERARQLNASLFSRSRELPEWDRASRQEPQDGTRGRDSYLQRDRATKEESVAVVKEEPAGDLLFVPEVADSSVLLHSGPDLFPTSNPGTENSDAEDRNHDPAPWRSPQAREPLPEGCKCPINLQCPARDNDKSDCRTLVPDHWRRWEDAERDLFREM